MKNELIHSPLFTCRIVEVARKEGEEEKKRKGG
jgi:stalled ribosome alternative rescue factor ArfA